MNEEEMKALIGRFIAEAGGRYTFLKEDPNGRILLNHGKRYTETDDESAIPAVVVPELPPGLDSVLNFRDKEYQIVIYKNFQK